VIEAWSLEGGYEEINPYRGDASDPTKLIILVYLSYHWPTSLVKRPPCLITTNRMDAKTQTTPPSIPPSIVTDTPAPNTSTLLARA